MLYYCYCLARIQGLTDGINRPDDLHHIPPITPAILPTLCYFLSTAIITPGLQDPLDNGLELLHNLLHSPIEHIIAYLLHEGSIRYPFQLVECFETLGLVFVLGVPEEVTLVDEAVFLGREQGVQRRVGLRESVGEEGLGYCSEEL